MNGRSEPIPIGSIAEGTPVYSLFPWDLDPAFEGFRRQKHPQAVRAESRERVGSAAPWGASGQGLASIRMADRVKKPKIGFGDATSLPTRTRLILTPFSECPLAVSLR
jgi:hypothetical protein